MIDLLSPLMAIMLFVSHMTSSYPSCPKECHCYHDTGMLTANCTSLPASSENIEVLNLNARLQGHNIELSEGQFTDFKKLKYLNLRNCSISSVHKKSFFGIKSLVEIDLSYNKIQSLDSAVFQHITDLTTVILRGNRFNFDSDDPFLISNTIEHLDIGDCGITQLPPGLFYEIKRIKYIMLDNNRLKHLKHNSLPRGLVYLNLSNNSIVNVPTDLLGSLKHLTKLDLSGNPINCTCSLMNLQDHLSGLGVTFEHEVICAFPTKYEGVSWNKVNENELCIEETLYNERIPIKPQKRQETFKYQTNHKHQISNNEKNNYFDANIQSDQPYDKQDPNAEVLFQNDDTKAMGEMMRVEDGQIFDNQELKNTDYDNQESNLENLENHFLPSKNNFPDEMLKKTSFDDIHVDSEHKTESADIVESHVDNIDSFKETTLIPDDLEKNNNTNEEFGEQNDGSNVIEESITDKVQEFKEGTEVQETHTELALDVKTSDAIQEGNQDIVIDAQEKSENENNKNEIDLKESKEHDLIETTTLDNKVAVTDIDNSQLQNITSNEEKETLIENPKGDEMKITTEKTDEVTTQNVNVEKEIIEKTENILSGGKTEETPLEGQLNLENTIEKTIETESKTENIIEEITTQNAINEDVEFVGSLGVDSAIHTNEKLKLENSIGDQTTNQNIQVIETTNQNVIEHETESIVEAGENALAEEIPTTVKDANVFGGSSHEGTEEPKVDTIIEAGVEIKSDENKNDENAHGSDIVLTTENIELNIATEKQTEPTIVEVKNNVEGSIDNVHLYDLENQPIITTTDAEVLTTLKNEKQQINIDAHLQSVGENTNFTVNEVGTTELPVNVEDIANISAVGTNETLIEEANTTVAVDNFNQEPTIPYVHNENVNETVDSLTTPAYLHPTNIPDLVNQENNSDVTQPDQSPTELLPVVHINPEVISTENASIVLGNIKQGEIANESDEDDNLIGDKSLQEMIPMEFEPAHVVLGCIVVLISVLVLVAVYKCTTEGKKTSRTPKDVESNQGTEMQDMASLLPKPNNEEPKIVSKKYPDEAPTSETVSLIQEEKKDVPTEIKPSRENENSLNNNTPASNKPTNQPASVLAINPAAPIQRTRVKVGIIPESIPRTPIFVQKSYNNGVTSS